MLVGDFGEHSFKALWGHRAELSIACFLQKLNENVCKDNGIPGFNWRTLSCTDGWCQPCHADSVLWPTLDFAHRTALLEPIPEHPQGLLLEGSAQALHGGSSNSHAVLHLLLSRCFYGYPPPSRTHRARKEAGLHSRAARPVMYRWYLMEC